MRFSVRKTVLHVLMIPDVTDDVVLFVVQDRMRFSLRKTVLGVLVIAVLQLTVYYWVVVQGRRARHPAGLSRLTPIVRQYQQRPHKQGTCDNKVLRRCR